MTPDPVWVGFVRHAEITAYEAMGRAQLSLLILPDLGTTLTSGRVLQRLRPVRAAANPSKAAECCEQFDATERALRSSAIRCDQL